MSAIEVTGLVKHYGDVAAVDGIDLHVGSGEVFALLGPNGAGKSTAVEILEGHRTRSAGQVAVLGFDPEAGGRPFRERIGIVLQETALERELTVTEILDVYRRSYPKRRDAAELIDLIGLSEKASARIKTLSGGQKRRLELALGLVGDPDLLFLDEPTTGFDPSARRQAWTVIDNLRSLGKTILLTTHYMDEAQRLSDRVAVIRRGRIVAEGPPDALGGRAEGESIVRFRIDDGETTYPLPVAAVPDQGGLVVSTSDATMTLHTLTGWALDHGVELVGLTVERRSLEDVYLDLVGEEGDDE